MKIENKKIFANNLSFYMEQKGVDRNTLCADLDLKYTTVRDWLKGITYPRIGKIELLANYFNINKSDLIENKISTAQPSDSLLEKITNTARKLNTDNKKIILRTSEELLEAQKGEENEERFEYHVFEKLSAGTGYGYTEDRNYDTVYFDKDIAHDLASWVYGDSMEPKFVDGSVALIKDTGWDYDGAIYAVDWDGQTYIKKVYREPDGLRLVSLNPKYKDRFAPYDEDPRIIGKIVGNFMPLGN